MKFVFLILLLLFPVVVSGSDDAGMYISIMSANNKDSDKYTNIDLGYDGSKHNWQGFGGYLGILFLLPKSDNPHRGSLGVNFGVRKLFKFKVFKGYEAFTPYIGAGGYVTYSSEKIEESGNEYKKVTDIAFHSLVPSAGIRLPITKHISIVPNVRYMLPINKDNSSIFAYGVTLRYGNKK